MVIAWICVWFSVWFVCLGVFGGFGADFGHGFWLLFTVIQFLLRRKMKLLNFWLKTKMLHVVTSRTRTEFCALDIFAMHL